jgi:RNA polymerase sigma-70 factor (ECF subfamily)
MGAAATDDAQRVLALAAAGGDRAALEQLLADNFDFVHAVCRRITANADDALDAAQDALIAVVRGISSYDGRSKFTTWLYRVATNASLMLLRARRRRPETVEMAAEPASSVSGPAERVAARIDVDQALAALPEEYRVVVVLREIHDLEYGEIAEVLDLPVGTVRSRLNRGRAALVSLLGNSEPGSGIGEHR